MINQDEVEGSVPIILGPTGVGKTDIVHRAAAGAGVEIISADSRAIYRGMNIGTATPPESFREELSYHLINFLHPRERFSAMDFRNRVEEKMRDIWSRENGPVIVGGSRLYILALTQGIFEGPEADESLREKLRKMPRDELHHRLEEVDPASARKIHPNDTKRVIRALEVYKLTGRPINELKQEAEPLPVDFVKVSLNRPRSKLYERVESRVDEMMNEGLLEEVKSLIAEGFNPGWGAWNTIGYKELARHIVDEKDLSSAVEDIKRNTRHLVKYQQNWIKSLDLDLSLDLCQCERGEVTAKLESYF